MSSNSGPLAKNDSSAEAPPMTMRFDEINGTKTESSRDIKSHYLLITVYKILER